MKKSEPVPSEKIEASKPDPKPEPKKATAKRPSRSTRSSATLAPPKAPVELPATDAAISSGADLVSSIQERISALVDGVEFVASPSGADVRARLGGKTLAYLTPSSAKVKIHVTGAEAKPIYRATAVADAEPAIALIATVAKALAA